jgi:uncharacterized membrane protein YfcA
MEFELNLITGALLALAGFAAGFINIIAGGGAMITVPLMILFGMPADVANGSNRLAVITQSLVAVQQFNEKDIFKGIDLVALLAPTVFGTILGALLISYLPEEMIKMTLLGTMIVIALAIMFFPESVFSNEQETPLHIKEKPTGFFWMFLAGFYGGAIQAGVGFLLIAILGGVLRYDLVRGNALKMACTLLFGCLSLLIFVWRGQVWWGPAIILAVSSVLGVVVSVNFALKVEQKVLKRILLGMVVLACVSALITS